jgi:HD-GYP domain-containing protein (c-di-GMP phosphodiesterase class II)/ABC-type amino acid transport substrate-binding protein
MPERKPKISRVAAGNARLTKKWFFLILFTSSLLFLAPSTVFARQSIRVGIYENMPKVFTSESGKPSGIFVDILEAIAQREDWKIEYVHGTWAEGLDRLAAREIDLMPDVAYTSERASIFAFTHEPVLSDWSQLYARRGSGIRSIPDLKGKRVSILERSVQQDAFNRLLYGFELPVTLVPFPDYPAAFRAVEEGKADVAVANRFFGSKNAQRYNLEDTSVVFNPTHLFFAASRTIDKGLLNILDRDLADLKKNPESTYYKTLRRWTSEEFKGWIPSWLKKLAAILGVLALLGGGSAIVLRNQVNTRTKELKESMGALKAAYQHWESTFNAVQEGIWVLDADANILLTNPATAHILDNPYDCNDANSTRSSCRKERGHGLNRLLLNVARKTKRRETKTAFVGGRWLKITVDPVIKENGKINGFIRIVSDVSNLKRAEEEMKDKTNKIRVINQELQKKVLELKNAWEQTVHVLANASEARDPYTAGHQRRVAMLSEAIAKEMGMEEDRVRHIELAALVHDIGKIEIPSELLSKPGKLSEIEFQLIKTHPAAALRILQPIIVPWPLAEIVYQHHERMDGKGYPRGLKGKEILLEARIICAADTVEAMSSHRPYRPALGLESALQELKNFKGIGFDEEVVEACLKVFEKGFNWEE